MPIEFNDLPMVLKPTGDWFMPDHNWYQIIAEGGVFTDYNVPDSWWTRISFSFVKGTIGLGKGGAYILDDCEVSMTQIYMAYKLIQEPGYVPSLLRDDCLSLREVGSFGDGGHYRMKNFMRDMNRKSESGMREVGISDPTAFRSMALAYFVLSKRKPGLGGSVEQWHLTGSRMGYPLFFELALNGLGIATISEMADAGMDGSIIRDLMTA